MQTSNTHRPSLYQDGLLEYAADGSLAIEDGDFLYADTDDAKPASSQADAGSESANQAAFASNFIGVANGQRVAHDASPGVIRVRVTGRVKRPCDPDTYEIGDYVALAEDATGAALENQKVKKTGVAADAVGVVTERHATNTTRVEFEILTQFTKRIAGN